MHISQLHTVVKHGEFSIRFVAQTGEIITIDRCVCTSYHSAGRTLNIKLCESEEVRKVVRITITHINGKQIYL